MSRSKSNLTFGKIVGVGLEGRLGAGALSTCRPRFTSVVGLPAGVLLDVALLVPLHFDHDPGRQRADDGDTDAMQSAGDLVAALVELAAGMQTGHHDFERRSGLPWDECSTGIPRPLSSTVTLPFACSVDGDDVASSLRAPRRRCCRRPRERVDEAPSDRCRRCTFRAGGEPPRALPGPEYPLHHKTTSTAAFASFQSRGRIPRTELGIRG